MITLTVVREFGEYAKGAVITDPMTISQILAGHNQRDVLKVNAPDQPALSEAYLEAALASGELDDVKTLKPKKVIPIAIAEPEPTILTTKD